jgi:hypothetical protein
LEKRKIKICDFDGRKIDSVIISNEKDVKIALKNWKKKGLF